MKCELSNEKMLELNRDKTKAYNELYIVTVTRKTVTESSGPETRQTTRSGKANIYCDVAYRDGMTVSLCRLR